MNDGTVAVWYRLAGAFDPHDVTERTGIRPDRYWVAGDRADDGTLQWQDGWEVDSGLPGDQPCHAHLAALMERLRPGIDVLADLADGQTATVIVAAGPGSLSWIEPETVRGLAALRVEVAFEAHPIEDEATLLLNPEAALLQMLADSDEPLYSCFAEMEERVGEHLTLAEFFVLVDDLVERGLLCLYWVDGAQQVHALEQVPSDLAYRYGEISHQDPRFDPYSFGLGLTEDGEALIQAQKPEE